MCSLCTNFEYPPFNRRSPRKQRPSDSSEVDPTTSQEKLSALRSSTSELLVAEIDRITQAQSLSPTSSLNSSSDFGAYVATANDESAVAALNAESTAATPGAPDASTSPDAQAKSVSPTSSSPARKKNKRSPQKQQAASEVSKCKAKPGEQEEKLSAQAKSPSRKPMRSSLRQPKVISRFKSASSTDDADGKGSPSRAKAADKSGRTMRRSPRKSDTTPKAKRISKAKSLRKCKTAPPAAFKKVRQS